MEDSLGFSSFRALMDDCDAVMEDFDLRSKIMQAMNGNELCFFFVKDGGVYGGPEDSRMSFARMKSPDPGEEMDDGDFMGISLDDILGDSPVHRLFGKPDIDDLEILDQETAADRALKNHKSKKKSGDKKGKK